MKKGIYIIALLLVICVLSACKHNQRARLNDTQGSLSVQNNSTFVKNDSLKYKTFLMLKGMLSDAYIDRNKPEQGLISVQSEFRDDSLTLFTVSIVNDTVYNLKHRDGGTILGWALNALLDDKAAELPVLPFEVRIIYHDYLYITDDSLLIDRDSFYEYLTIRNLYSRDEIHYDFNREWKVSYREIKPYQTNWIVQE